MARQILLFQILLVWCSCVRTDSDIVAVDLEAGGAKDGSMADRGVDTAPACGSSNCQGCCISGSVCATGTSHTQCGGAGAPCVDCTGFNSTCAGGACTNCTPLCSDKLCGASDGCGGACKAGSGCCTPACNGKLCGVSDSCGGTCKSGSGCCTPACSGKLCGATDGCGGTCKVGSGCCTPACSGKLCGASNGCGGTCKAGSGCCTPACSGKLCGATDGCGGTCKAGSGCCTPACSGKLCGAADGCGGTCKAGSGCCTPVCSGKPCGATDGCGGTCQAGSGCCTPACSGKLCGASDGCGGTCQAGSGCCTAACSGKLCGAADGCGGTCEAGSGCTVPACAYKGDADTLVLFTFEGTGTTVTDVAGSHNGKIVGSGVKRVSGKSTCGQAMDFSITTPASYVEVPDSTAWDLLAGSVDFWVRFDGTNSGARGLVSRDANGNNKAGHITIYRMCNGSIMVRLQDTASSYARCSEPVSNQTWYHVGVNFGGTGGLELHVGGKLVNRTASIICGSTTWPCGASTSKGIVGNDNPWVLGASASHTSEGTATGADYPFNGQIDSFRVSKARRSF